ncbi:nitrous oxide-stimulated promoter family protein [Candidatus Bipolaricaulota bacterium]|nr:nitrous oxide-stimulated promoter family protein [Candidatus Bipolaricaulota bacterium]MCK5586515.1 nitrous oxide-stimulated promoter family protein [Candidatus Bipolaricaulota bacterium]
MVRLMVELYCKGNHSRTSLCESCGELLRYAQQQVESCPYGSKKPACRRCTIHCYDADHRDRIRAVMRYAGPRLLFRHPLLAVRHMLR